jgi:hypothetical protein
MAFPHCGKLHFPKRGIAIGDRLPIIEAQVQQHHWRNTFSASWKTAVDCDFSLRLAEGNAGVIVGLTHPNSADVPTSIKNTMQTGTRGGWFGSAEEQQDG